MESAVPALLSPTGPTPVTAGGGGAYLLRLPPWGGKGRARAAGHATGPEGVGEGRTAEPAPSARRVSGIQTANRMAPCSFFYTSVGECIILYNNQCSGLFPTLKISHVQTANKKLKKYVTDNLTSRSLRH